MPRACANGAHASKGTTLHSPRVTSISCDQLGRMGQVPKRKPIFQVNMTTKPFPMPRACAKGVETRGQDYSMTFCYGHFYRTSSTGKDGSSPQEETYLSG